MQRGWAATRPAASSPRGPTKRGRCSCRRSRAARVGHLNERTPFPDEQTRRRGPDATGPAEQARALQRSTTTRRAAPRAEPGRVPEQGRGGWQPSQLGSRAELKESGPSDGLNRAEKAPSQHTRAEPRWERAEPAHGLSRAERAEPARALSRAEERVKPARKRRRVGRERSQHAGCTALSESGVNAQAAPRREPSQESLSRAETTGSRASARAEPRGEKRRARRA